MLKHFLLVNLNQLWRQKLYSAISLLSLTIGLVIFFLTLLYVRHEFSYNRGWQDSAQIYRVINQEVAGSTAFGANTLFDESQVLKIQDYVQDLVSHSVRATPLVTDINSADPEYSNTASLRAYLVESDIPDVFRFSVTAGDIQAVWDRPGQIALEAEKARMLFGSDAAALGQQVTLAGRTIRQPDTTYQSGQDVSFVVVAVYELPRPVTTATRFEAVLSMDSNSLQLLSTRRGLPEYSNNLWLKLLPGVSADLVERQLSDFAEREVNIRPVQQVLNVSYQYALEGLTEIYFNPDTVDSFDDPTGNLPRVYTFLVVGILVLLAGCSNSVSLGLAGALDRRREIGIRKSMGATGRNIFLQHQGESLLLTAVALIPVLLLIYLYHPVFYNLFDINTMPDPGLQDYLLLTFLSFCVAVAIGFYPSLVLSRLKPVLVLKPHAIRSVGRVFNLRTLLVTMQFVFAVLLMSIAFGLYLQLQHTLNRPAGFTPENLVQVYLETEDVRTSYLPGLLDDLRSTPGIVQAEAVSSGPSTIDNSGLEVIIRRTPDPADSVNAQRILFSAGQFELTDIPVLRGDPFSEPDREQTLTDERVPVVINRSAMNALGFAEPDTALGQEIYLNYQMLSNPDLRPVTISAVVEDSTYHNMKASPVPTIYSLSTSSIYIMFRYDEAIEENVVSTIAEIWERITGRPPFDVFFVEDYMTSAFSEEINESRLMILCAAVTMVLAAIGLYGLVSVNVRTAARDIAVRKVLGATSTRIVLSSLRQYSLPVLLSWLFAWPVAIYFVLQWIERFSYQLDKRLLLPVCLLAGLLVLCVAWLTLLRLVSRAASEKPVKSLRYE